MSKKLPPIHPGKILREEYMVPLNLSSNALARALNVSPARINEIVSERHGISADTALRLARFFNTDVRSWLNLQVNYDVQRGALMAHTFTGEAETMNVVYRMAGTLERRLVLVEDMREIGERELKRISPSALEKMNKLGGIGYQFSEHFKALSPSGQSAAKLIELCRRAHADNLRDARIWEWMLAEYRGLDADYTLLGARRRKQLSAFGKKAKELAAKAADDKKKNWEKIAAGLPGNNRACQDFCVLSHTLPIGQGRTYGKERHGAVFGRVVGFTAGRA